MSTRNRTQIMGYWINEPSILDHERLRVGMKNLARDGYGIVRLMLRNTNYTHRSPIFIEAVRVAVEAGHAVGIKVAIDTEPHREVGRDMGAEFPEATAVHLVPVKTRIVNGTFLLRAYAPGTNAHAALWDGVESAFVRTKDGVKKVDSFPFTLDWETSSYDNDRCLEQNYEFGRPMQGRRAVKLSGRLDYPEGTELIAYLRIKDIRLVDFWAEGFHRYYESLMECYRGIPLDGFGWDEPAEGCDWSSYRYGAGTAAAFEKMKGYRLADKLYLLDEPGMTPESVRVRLDYYEVINEGVAIAQEKAIAKAREVFGSDLLLGTHHTWQGEGGINDYRCGAVDYFRLNDNMDAGYTDCCWWDMDSVAYAYQLGSSLGRLTPSGEIECNTWHSKPTNAQVLYNARLMTLMDITWFNIWYGDDADTALYPNHYTWAQTVESTRIHHKYQTRLQGALPVVDVAIWHGWEGIMAMNSPEYTGAQKTCCMNTSRLFLERNVPFDFVDSRLIEKGSVADGVLSTDLGKYKVLVMPYAAVLPRGVWERCLEFARAGGKLIFTATPVEMDADGKSLSGDFAKLVEMPVLPLANYVAAVDQTCALSPGRPPRLDVVYPLRGDATRVQTSVEGEPHAMLNPAGNVLYMTDADPRVRLLDQVERWTSPEVKCFSESIQWRLYRKGNESILICIARKDQSMNGVVRFAGNEIEIKCGTLAFITERGGKVEVQGEDVDVSVRRLG
jgi:hypothetical protein